MVMIVLIKQPLPRVLYVVIVDYHRQLECLF